MGCPTIGPKCEPPASVTSRAGANAPSSTAEAELSLMLPTICTAPLSTHPARGARHTMAAGTPWGIRVHTAHGPAQAGKAVQVPCAHAATRYGRPGHHACATCTQNRACRQGATRSQPITINTTPHRASSALVQPGAVHHRRRPMSRSDLRRAVQLESCSKECRRRGAKT